MRPPLNAGENQQAAAAHDVGQQPTSMRPPLNAGENRARRGRRWPSAAYFNEAPAERGGKRGRDWRTRVIYDTLQ